MFGRNKTFSGDRSKRRFLFKVTNEADAEEAIKVSYQTFYALAAIQTAVLVFLSNFVEFSVEVFIDPALLLFFTSLVHLRRSRTAAIFLSILALLSACVTLGNRLGIETGDGVGGKNVLLAMFALYAAYYGLQGTFKYHKFSGSKVVTRNVWSMSALFVAYNVMVLLSLMAVVLAYESLRPGSLQSGEGLFSDDVLGTAVILCIILASAGTAFRILPWTKNKPLVANKVKDKHPGQGAAYDGRLANRVE